MERATTATDDRSLRPLLPWLRPHRGRVAASIVLGCAASAFEVAALGLLMVLLSVSDAGIEEQRLGPFSRVVPLLRGLSPNGQRAVLVGLILLGIAIRGVAWWTSAALRERVGTAVTATARRLAFARVARAPLAWLDAHDAGELDTLILRETERLGMSATGFVQIGVVAGMAACYLALLFYMAPALTLAAVAFLVIVAGAIRLLRRPVERQAQRSREESRPVAKTVHETLVHVRLLKSLGRADDAIERFDAADHKYLDAQRRQRIALDAIPPVSELSGAIVVLSILWIGSTWLSPRGGGGTAVLLTYVFTFYRLLPRFLALPSTRAALAANLSSVEVVNRLLADPAASPEPDGGRAPTLGPHRIALEGVRFRYGDDRPWVLDGVDLSLEPGRTTALVGRSGAGKSTIVELLLGMRRPVAGRVRVDGEDLQQLSGEAWRRRVGVVPQEPRLFDRSVRDNLRLVAPDASDERLWAALDSAAVADVVRALPGGLDATLGDQGSRLSGGERQRLCIARALLVDPTLLVFDEPTSQLDTESERAVTTALTRAAKGRTVLVIAHRLSTVRTAGEILMLVDGRLVERGSHAALVERDGAYARLVKLGVDAIE